MYQKLYAEDGEYTICLYGYVKDTKFKNPNAHILVSDNTEYLIYIFDSYIKEFKYYKDYYFMIILGTKEGGGVPYVFDII